MTARACSLCQWWVTTYQPATIGTCRAHPPAVNGGAPAWPATDADMWCGAFRISELLAGHQDRRLRTKPAPEAAHA